MMISGSGANALMELLDIVRGAMHSFRSAGAETITIHVDYFYSEQCNLEFDEGVLATLVKLRLPLTVSCHFSEDD